MFLQLNKAARRAHLMQACGHLAAAAADTAGLSLLRRQKYMSAYLQAHEREPNAAAEG